MQNLAKYCRKRYAFLVLKFYFTQIRYWFLSFKVYCKRVFQSQFLIAELLINKVIDLNGLFKRI